MRVIDCGTFTCPKCGNCYDWVYYDQDGGDNEKTILDLSPNAIAVKSYVVKDGRIEITIFCPSCGVDNTFYKTLG